MRLLTSFIQIAIIIVAISADILWWYLFGIWHPVAIVATNCVGAEIVFGYFKKNPPILYVLLTILASISAYAIPVIILHYLSNHNIVLVTVVACMGIVFRILIYSRIGPLAYNRNEANHEKNNSELLDSNK